MATNVFISYRRADTGDLAGRLAERLRESPGIGEVFMDVAGIEPGTDFASSIERALSRSDVCLVLIGGAWTGPAPRDDAGRTRIHDDDDFVRFEVRAALARGTRVLPILAHGANMPGTAVLPDDIQALSRLHAVTVQHDSFDRDADYLIDVVLQRRKPTTFGAYLKRHPVQATVLRVAAGCAVAVVALVLGAALLNAATGKSLDQFIGTGPVLLLIFVMLGAGALLPFLIGRRR